MPPVYTIASATAPAQATWLRLATSAGQRLACWGFWAGELHDATLQSRIALWRTTGGTVTNQTPELLDIDSRAADTVGASDASVNPTLVGQPLVTAGLLGTINNRGVQREWWAHPRFPILVDVSAFLSGVQGYKFSRFVAFSEAAGGTPSRAMRGRRGIRRGYWHQSDQHMRISNPTTDPTQQAGTQWIAIQRETWPDSFIPIKTIVLFAPAALVEPSMGSVTGSWKYAQNFAPVLAQMSAMRSFDAPVRDVAMGSVTPSRSFLSWLTRVFAASEHKPVTDVAVGQVTPRWPAVPTLSLRAFDIVIGQRIVLQPVGVRVFFITGITRDCAGVPLGNCQVLLFRTSDDALIGSTTSDGSGNYSLTVTDTTTQYFLVAYFPDAPDVAGTTRHDVVGS